jgi:hypothetical protein
MHILGADDDEESQPSGEDDGAADPEGGSEQNGADDGEDDGEDDVEASQDTNGVRLDAPSIPLPYLPLYLYCCRYRYCYHLPYPFFTSLIPLNLFLPPPSTSGCQQEVCWVQRRASCGVMAHLYPVPEASTHIHYL